MTAKKRRESTLSDRRKLKPERDQNASRTNEPDDEELKMPHFPAWAASSHLPVTPRLPGPS